jgi:hypothetical protein
MKNLGDTSYEDMPRREVRALFKTVCAALGDGCSDDGAARTLWLLVGLFSEGSSARKVAEEVIERAGLWRAYAGQYGITSPSGVRFERTNFSVRGSTPDDGLNPLREALRDCIRDHGLQGTKARFAPFATITDVPKEEINNVIARLRSPDDGAKR